MKYIFLPFAFGGNPASESGPRAVRAFLEESHVISTQDCICMEQSPDESAVQYLDRVYRSLSKIFNTNEKMILIGGNHLSIFPVYRYFYSFHSTILTLDAHCDCYAFNSINHASFMNFLENRYNTNHFISGVRAISEIPITPHQIIVDYYRQNTPPDFLSKDLPVDFLDIDVDVIDPDIFGWCGSPCDDGMTEEDIIHLVDCYRQKGGKVLAISEYIPNFDFQQKGLHIIMNIIDTFSQ